MKVVACFGLSQSCGEGSAGGSFLISSSRSLKPSCVIIAFLQLGKLGPVSLGILVCSRSLAMVRPGLSGIAVSC